MTTNALEHTKALLIYFIMNDAVNFKCDGQLCLNPNTSSECAHIFCAHRNVYNASDVCGAVF